MKKKSLIILKCLYVLLIMNFLSKMYALFSIDFKVAKDLVDQTD